MKQHHTSNEHLLILDSGDIIGGRGKKEQLKGEFLFKAFSQLKYDVINLGERDFLQGFQFLVEMKNKYNLPLISANIFQPGEKNLVFPAYVIKELKGFQQGDTFIPPVKAGIFGVTMYRSQLTYEQQFPENLI